MMWLRVVLICLNLNLLICLNLNLEFGVWSLFLKRAEQSAHVARRVVVHHGEHDGVHKRNHVLGAVGGDAQQHVGAEHVEEKNKVNEAGNVEHFVLMCMVMVMVIIYSNKKKMVC